MPEIKITDVPIASNLVAITFGVMGWKDFGDKKGLLLENTNSVHTFFVRFPLDLAFLNKEMVVVKIVKNLKPWCISPIIWQAKHTLEMPAGTIEKLGLKEKDKINLL